MMTSTLVESFDPEHTDAVHDAKMNYYCTRLATCSSDGTVKIFAVKNDEKVKLESELKGHEGAVMQVAWSHPKQGDLLATCGYDRKVIIWRNNGCKWEIAHTSEEFRDCVSYLSWAPHEHGVLLACSCYDGTVSVISGSSTNSNEFTLKNSFKAHLHGCTAVNWEPVFKCCIIEEETKNTCENSLNGPQAEEEPESEQQPKTNGLEKSNDESPVKRFVTGGVDGKLKIWKYDDDRDEWVEQNTLVGHKDWIRDVSWAPPFVAPRNMIASGSQDMKVLIWTPDDENNWSSQVLNEFEDVVWTVSWSEIGDSLAVTVGDGEVSVWKQGDEKQWVHVLDIEEKKEKKPETNEIS